MLDIEFIRTHRDVVARAMQEKKIEVDLDQLLALDEERRSLISKRDALLAERNSLSVEQSKQRGPALKVELSEIEPKLSSIQVEFDQLMLTVPQIPAADAPRGAAELAVEIKKVGEPIKFNFTPLDHIELGRKLDLIDTERGTAVSGYRGYYLKNEAALLHHGLMQLSLQIMRRRGFSVIVPPTIVRDFALVGNGQFPFGKDETYQIVNTGRLADGSDQHEPDYLAGTAEVPLLAYFANQTLNESDLPTKVCGISQCYRSEIGSYGKDTKGLYRVHEFMKVEQVILSPADEESQRKAFNELLEPVDELLSMLELPYRFMELTTEDMGAGKVKMYDVETWMPSRNAYGETHSASMLGDWQARRLNIKYRDAEGKKKLVYTLNNTVVASPRILIALLENHQQADGSVRIPEALQPYVGTDVIKPKA